MVSINLTFQNRLLANDVFQQTHTHTQRIERKRDVCVGKVYTKPTIQTTISK